MSKRYRRPKLKDGELRVMWGRIPELDGDDVIYWRGEGVANADAAFVHACLDTERRSTNWHAPLGSPRILWTVHEPSMLEELEKRGYDLTTLKFSIQKKVKTT